MLGSVHIGNHGIDLELMIFLYSMLVGKDLDILRMGDDSARALGIDTKRIRGATVVLTCLVTAVVVAFAGPIGFVCILAPQIGRRIVGNGLRWLIPTSAMVGGMILLLADIVARTILSPVMLPVGAITALIGSPVLVYMLFSKRVATV